MFSYTAALVVQVEMRKLTQTTSPAFWIDSWMVMTTDCDLALEVNQTLNPEALFLMTFTYQHRQISCCTVRVVQLLITVAGGVTEVKTDIFVTSFGPVSDVEMVRYYRCKEMYVC